MDHGHGHDTHGMGDGRLIAAIAVNLVLTVAQVAGGIVSGSLALVADAVHNLSDASSLVIALIARRVSRRPADYRRTFGYQRAETIGALINLTTLIVVGLYLMYEAVLRYFEDQVIDGWIVVIVAGIALVIDIVTALLTYAGSRESLNIRAAFIHNVSDALASVGVIIAGTLIILFDLTIADLLVTVLISAYILYQGFTLIGDAIQVLMEGTPGDIRLNDVVAKMLEVEGVGDVHHVHIWEPGEQSRALEAHMEAAGRSRRASGTRGSSRGIYDVANGSGSRDPARNLRSGVRLKARGHTRKRSRSSCPVPGKAAGSRSNAAAGKLSKPRNMAGASSTAHSAVTGKCVPRSGARLSTRKVGSSPSEAY